MTVEVAIVISGISLAFAVYFGISNLKRNQKVDANAEKQEVKQEVSELTTVIIKLENISTGISEIKAEMSNVKIDMKDLRERLVRVEESSKQAHKRLDEMRKGGDKFD